MGRSAAAQRPVPRSKRHAATGPKPRAATRPKPRAATRPKAQPARHGTRRRTVPARRPASAQRRVSGRAVSAAPAVALPVRVLNAPFARAARARTSSLLDALLSGRGWIALVFVLLAGIVFFNVDLLQMNREIARNADKISGLKRENARLLLDEARLASSERIQESAAQLGLVLPAPGEVRYLKARPTRDATQAMKRITAPNPAYVAPEPVATAPEPVAPAGMDPAATTGVDPAATQPTATDPAATTPPVDPAATAEPAPTTTTAPAG